MKQVNLYEAETNLAALVDLAAGREDLAITKSRKPRAVIVSLLSVHDGESYRLPTNFHDADPEIEAIFYPGLRLLPA